MMQANQIPASLFENIVLNPVTANILQDFINSRISCFKVVQLYHYILYIAIQNINYSMLQVVFTLSHVLLALVKMAVKKNIIPSMNMFPWFAALVQGTALVMFEYEQSTVHPSLSASMIQMFMNTGLTSGTCLCTIHCYNSC